MPFDYAARHWRDGLISAGPSAPAKPASTTGFGLGDGVFETIAFRQNQLEHWDAHMARMREALAYFGLQGLPSDAELKAAALDLLGQAPFGKTQRLRITMARLGEGTTVEMVFAEHLESDAEVLFQKSSVLRPAQNPSSRYKTLGYTDLLAAQRKMPPKVTALLLNEWGRVACACYGNVYALVDGRWITPAVEEGALPGIIRGDLLAQGFLEGLPLVEGRLEWEKLSAAPWRFSNSMRGLLAARVVR